MMDLVIIAVVAAILAVAGGYIYKAKKERREVRGLSFRWLFLLQLRLSGEVKM